MLTVGVNLHRISDLILRRNQQILFEIQSLRSGSLSYELVGKATQGDKSTPFRIVIDEPTYQGISDCVHPEGGARYRLSLQYRWNPFRQQYFSSVTEISPHQQRRHYFLCSAAYQDALTQLQNVTSLRHLKRTFRYPEQASSLSVQHAVKRTLQVGIMGLSLAVGTVFLSYDKSDDISRTIATSEAEVISTDVRAEDTKIDHVSIVPEEPEQTVEGLRPGSPDEVALGTTVVRNLPRDFVALTFDDGPSPYTREIVDILRQHQVGATFFFIGAHAVRYPEAVKYVKDNNMAVGNHSWNHISLVGKTYEEMRAEITHTNDYLQSLIDAPITVVRPPFGHFDDQLVSMVADDQMKVILWNYDPRDWQANSSEEILNYVLSTDPSGGIYLLHENELTVEVLPEIISHLKQGNLQFAMLK